jgi:hypothetical protein
LLSTAWASKSQIWLQDLQLPVLRWIGTFRHGDVYWRM